MALRHKLLRAVAVLNLALLFAYAPAKAQVYTAQHDVADTIAKEAVTHPGYYKDQPSQNINAAIKPRVEFDGARFTEELQTTISKVQERKKLMDYLRELDVDKTQNTNTAHKKVFYHLANAFARLKLYPLAMKCFLKTMEPTRKERKLMADSLAADSLLDDFDEPDSSNLTFTADDDTAMAARSVLGINIGQQHQKSPPITYQKITDTFNDGKTATAYAMLIHVKQPVPGKRKVYTGTNSGHTYITLIKYNTDSSYVSLSFGFYPKKQHLLAGTPAWPSANSLYRNDANYKWDEVAGKFISKRRFEKILALTQKYDGVKYHLSTNNCTDFSLKAASLADIHIPETTGSWPLGHGNNPGITGQSMLQGKVYRGNGDSQTGLFIDHDIAVATAQ